MLNTVHLESQKWIEAVQVVNEDRINGEKVRGILYSY